MSTPPPPISYDVTTLTAEDFYGYSPSTALAAIALALFLILGLIVAVQIFKSKNKNAIYMYTVTVCGFTEAAGYAALLWIISNSGEKNIYPAYVVSQVCIILSPNLQQTMLQPGKLPFYLECHRKNAFSSL